MIKKYQLSTQPPIMYNYIIQFCELRNRNENYYL